MDRHELERQEHRAGDDEQVCGEVHPALRHESEQHQRDEAQGECDLERPVRARRHLQPQDVEDVRARRYAEEGAQQCDVGDLQQMRPSFPAQRVSPQRLDAAMPA